MKKIISMGLALVMLIGAFSSVNLSALAGSDTLSGTSETFDFTAVAGTSSNKNTADVMSDVAGENLLYQNSAITYSLAVRNLSNNSTAGATTWSYATNAGIADGLCGGKTEVSYTACGNMAVNGSETEKFYAKTDKIYCAEVIVDLGREQNIHGIMLSSAYESAIGDYDLFLGNDKSTIFNGTPAASYTFDQDYWYDAARTASDKATLGITKWNLKSGKTATAQYVGFRIYITTMRRPLTSTEDPNAKYYYNRIRFNEIAVYGSKIESVSVSEDISAVANKVNTEENLVKGYAQFEKYVGGTFTLEKDSEAVAVSDDFAALVNGNHNEEGVAVSAFDKITFAFPNVAELTDVLLVSAAKGISKYNLYLSGNPNDLYNELNNIYTYEGESAAQLLSFTKTQSGKYLGIEIVEGDGADLSEIAVFGSCVDTAKDRATDPVLLEDVKNRLSTIDNLINPNYIDYVFADGSVLDFGTVGTFGLGGMYKGNSNIQQGPSITSYETGNDLIDGNIDSHADFRINTGAGLIRFVETQYEGGFTFAENTYTDLSVSLNSPAYIDSIYTAWPTKHNGERFRPQEIEYYVTDGDFSTLYNEENRVESLTGLTEEKYNRHQVVMFATPKKAKHVGIRVRKGVSETYEAGAGSSYMRMTEFAVFGEYDCEYFDYTATATKGDFLEESGAIYNQGKLKYTLPLADEGYSFKKWLVNGKEVESTVDRVANTTTFATKVTEDIAVQAVYEEDAADLTTSAYKIDKDKSLILLPKSSFGFETYYSFDNYRNTVVIKDGEGNVVPESNRIKTGMTASTTVENAKTYEIITRGDTNLDGAVTVSDIYRTIEEILGKSVENTDKQLFAMDANGSGRITVSDMVLIRTDILTDLSSEVYEANQYTLNDMEYKVLGRKNVSNEGTANETLNVGAQASGISFNADCAGTVKLLYKSNILSQYATVVVDGVEHDVELTIPDATKFHEVVIANVPAGHHTISVYKQIESGTMNFGGVKINGETLEAPADKKYYFEFVGDSMTAAYGNLLLSTDYKVGDRHQNGYLSYAAVAGRLLDVDHSLICVSGSVMVKHSGLTHACMQDRYDYVNGVAYDFANSRKADAVVVALGANDGRATKKLFPGDDDMSEEQAFYKAQAKQFARKIISKNKATTKVVFALSGHDLVEADRPEAIAMINAAYAEAVEELKAEGISAYYIPYLPYGIEGVSRHPVYWGEKGTLKAGEVAAEFLRDYVIADLDAGK